MKKIMLLPLIVLLFSQCKTDSGWTEAQKDKLRKGCTDGLAGTVEKNSAVKYCDCVVEQAMKKYKSSAEMDKNGTEEEGKKMGTACISELLPPGPKASSEETTPAPIGWTEEAKNKFKDNCVQNTIKSGHAQQAANNYCSCVLVKLMAKYKTSEEADKYGTEEDGKQMGEECLSELDK